MSNEIVSTLITPATGYDLTDLAAVKLELGIDSGDASSDAFLTGAISQASKAASNYCNRVFQAETLSDLIYIDRHRKSPLLQLSRWPAVSVTSVTLNAGLSDQAALVAGTDYQLKADVGQLLRIDVTDAARLQWCARTVTVLYQAGFSTVPYDVIEACLRIVTMRFRAKGRDPMLVSSDSGGIGNQRYWVGNVPGHTGAFTPEITALLDPYCVPVAA